MLSATKKVVLEKKTLLLSFLERWVSFAVLCLSVTQLQQKFFLKFARRAVLRY